MTSDSLLDAVALVELVARQGGDTCDLDDALSLLAGTSCGHAAVSLYLAGALVNVAKATGFDLNGVHR